MCGIYGVLRPGGVTPGDRALFDRVGDLLRHRGPDGSAELDRPGALIGMHRLSIMDIEGGGQPFWSENGQIGVVGNGEIYNAASLREQLQDRGHRFHSLSDIEVVPHLFEEYGVDAFSRLRGMFALAVIDARDQTVTLARDPMGEKPLSFSTKEGRLVFSSEQTPLVRSGAVPLNIDERVLIDYLLYGFVPEPASIIAGVGKLPAGHFLRYSLLTGQTEEVGYWSPLDFVGDAPWDPERVAAVVDDAVRAACLADTPIAIALSGGLDSSLVAALASRERPDLHALTIGYEGDVASDESAQALAFAARLGISSERVVLDTRSVVDSFATVCARRDEPIADIAGPAYDALAKAARVRGYPVLMNGQGGDELFWGYNWVLDHARARLQSYRPAVARPPRAPQALATWARTLGGLKTRRWSRQFMQEWGTHECSPIPLWETQMGYPWIYKGINDLTGRSRRDLQPRLWGHQPPADWAAPDITTAGLGTYLRVNGLAQMDRLTMAHSVEARTPLVDRYLVETVMGSRLHDGLLHRAPKAGFREVAARLLPHDIMSRPKRGFTPPIRTWAKEIRHKHREQFDDPAICVYADLDPIATKRYLNRPVTPAGRVDQVGLRLMTLELWMSGQTIT